MPHEITFRDADFPRRDALWWSQLEKWHIRWTPYGMPRLTSHFASSVFFLQGLNPGTGEVGPPGGSGVIIGYFQMRALRTCTTTL